jgi:hypothetical protein
MSLLREAALEARSLYPELIAPGAPMPANPPQQARAAYFVAFLAGTPVGCGAWRRCARSTCASTTSRLGPSLHCPADRNRQPPAVCHGAVRVVWLPTHCAIRRACERPHECLLREAPCASQPALTLPSNGHTEPLRMARRVTSPNESHRLSGRSIPVLLLFPRRDANARPCARADWRGEVLVRTCRGISSELRFERPAGQHGLTSNSGARR